MKFKDLLRLLLRNWKYLAAIYFLFTLFALANLYRQVSYQQVNPGNKSKILFSLDFCYELAIRNETCSPSYNFKTVQKIDFPENCTFTLPIQCHTKGFRELTIREILMKFKRCDIAKLVKIDRAPVEVEYKIYFGNICVKNRFEINFKNGNEIIRIQPQQKNQIFSVTISSRRQYDADEQPFRSPIVNIFRRFCWSEVKFNLFKKNIIVININCYSF